MNVPLFAKVALGKIDKSRYSEDASCRRHQSRNERYNKATIKMNKNLKRIASILIALTPLLAAAQSEQVAPEPLEKRNNNGWKSNDFGKELPTGLPSAGKLISPTDTKLTDAPVSVVDQLIALEQDLQAKGIKINWSDVYSRYNIDFDPNKIDGEARMSVMLGFKVADGTVALKAQNAEKLLECADVIETLAKRLNIPEAQLQRGYNIRNAVKRGDWMDAFMQLQMYRQDIMRTLEKINGNDRSKAVLIVCGGWYQASRIVMGTLKENYDPVMTNYLRAPLLVLLMKHELENLKSPEIAGSPQVKLLLSDIDKIYTAVNLNKNQNIPEGQLTPQKLSELYNLANRFVISNLFAED